MMTSYQNLILNIKKLDRQVKFLCVDSGGVMSENDGESCCGGNCNC